jgi:hypothetical protein
MMMPMTTPRRAQQRYDHRLRDLVQGSGDMTVVTDLGIPRSTARLRSSTSWTTESAGARASIRVPLYRSTGCPFTVCRQRAPVATAMADGLKRLLTSPGTAPMFPIVVLYVTAKGRMVWAFPVVGQRA